MGAVPTVHKAHYWGLVIPNCIACGVRRGIREGKHRPPLQMKPFNTPSIREPLLITAPMLFSLVSGQGLRAKFPG